MRGPYSIWASALLEIVQYIYDVPVIYSKSQVVVTNPYNSHSGSFAVCDHCVPRESITAPGLGIDLTSSYGYVQLHAGFCRLCCPKSDMISGLHLCNTIMEPWLI
jgi:hypothetical protein